MTHNVRLSLLEKVCDGSETGRKLPGHLLQLLGLSRFLSGDLVLVNRSQMFQVRAKTLPIPSPALHRLHCNRRGRVKRCRSANRDHSRVMKVVFPVHGETAGQKRGHDFGEATMTLIANQRLIHTREFRRGPVSDSKKPLTGRIQEQHLLLNRFSTTRKSLAGRKVTFSFKVVFATHETLHVGNKSNIHFGTGFRNAKHTLAGQVGFSEVRAPP